MTTDEIIHRCLRQVARGLRSGGFSVSVRLPRLDVEDAKAVEKHFLNEGYDVSVTEPKGEVTTRVWLGWVNARGLLPQLSQPHLSQASVRDLT